MNPARAFERQDILEFAADVRAGLSKPQKELPSRYLYDELGSALFEAITVLPEYGLTRADQRLLERHAAELGDGYRIVAELGSGSGRKTRWILEALGTAHAVWYFPIDLSPSALERCREELKELAEIRVVNESYLDGLRSVVTQRPPGHRLLVLFLGSTIGNFDPPCRDEFLARIRGLLIPGDALLLGCDLVKPVGQMLVAYDDPTGVTAAFNLNLLGRINRELDGNFVLRNFEHEARYDHCCQRIEMHLRSRVVQTVEVPSAGFACRFDRGETIWTESSYKFRIEEIHEMAHHAGFLPRSQWIDHDWPFAESLWVAQ